MTQRVRAYLRGQRMRRVTKYAMLALFSASFIALNNCGNQTASTDKTSNHDNGQASDFALVGTPPIAIVPGPLDVPIPIFGVEIDCNNGMDDDGDGAPDCMDVHDCGIHPECSEWGPPLEELINSRATTVWPNGIIVPEDVVFLKARGADDDDAHGWQRDNFFAHHQKDCWIDPRYQDPYFFIGLGEPLIADPLGPTGPLTSAPFPYFGPRAGLINECEFGTDLMFHHMDDDNGAGAGAAGDTDDDEGGAQDDN